MVRGGKDSGAECEFAIWKIFTQPFSQSLLEATLWKIDTKGYWCPGIDQLISCVRCRGLETLNTMSLGMRSNS